LILWLKLMLLKTELVHFFRRKSMPCGMGEFHDQEDAKWIVIRRSLWGHNKMPCGWPAPSQPIGRPESGRPQGVIGVF
jgi:hypothetical protein